MNVLLLIAVLVLLPLAVALLVPFSIEHRMQTFLGGVLLGAIILSSGRPVVNFGKDVPEFKAPDTTQSEIAWKVFSLGCSRTQIQSPTLRIAVVDAKPGEYRPSNSKVRVISFDDAYKLATTGKVWVVGWCKK